MMLPEMCPCHAAAAPASATFLGAELKAGGKSSDDTSVGGFEGARLMLVAHRPVKLESVKKMDMLQDPAGWCPNTATSTRPK